MQFPKDKIYRSEEFRDYVKTLPCIICGRDSDAHHEIGGGTALKGPDLFCIPLCRKHHDERGAGVETFWKKHNKDRWQVIAETLAGYVEQMEGKNV